MRVRALIHPLQARTRKHKHAPQVIGIAHPDVLTEMKREFLGAPDSGDAFTAWNSGPNETNCIKEWHFVVDPFEDTPGWQDLSPEEWTPRFEYGGNRIPIRVQVCAMCAHAHSPAGSCGVYATRYLLS